MMFLRNNILIFILVNVLTIPLAGQTASFTVDTVEGCDSIQVSFTNNSIDGGLDMNFSWNFGNGATSNSATPGPVWYNKPGIYYPKLTMTDNDNPDNKYTFTDTIFVRPHPNAFFFIADTFRLGNLVYRFRSGKAPSDTINYRYVWTLNPNTNGTFDSRIIHTRAKYVIPISATDSVKRDTLIYRFSGEGTNVMRLKVSDYYGCVDSMDQTFQVSEKMLIPDVFTPNGDNINDNFFVPTNGRTVFSLKIFSMTGQLVYKSESLSILWDGRLPNGSFAWPGTYLYIIERVSGEIAKKQKGFILLLR